MYLRHQPVTNTLASAVLSPCFQCTLTNMKAARLTCTKLPFLLIFTKVVFSVTTVGVSCFVNA